MKIVESQGRGAGALTGPSGFDSAELLFEYKHPEQAHKPFKLDLTPGLEFFTPRFLLALKAFLTHHAGLGLRPNTLGSRLRAFNRLLSQRVMDGLVDVLTVDHLIGLANADGFQKSYLRELAWALEQAFKLAPFKRELFDDQFNPAALEVLKRKKNTLAGTVRGIATKSKSLNEFAQVMSRLESALVNEEITYGQWAYFAVQMATACRHESLLHCTVSDLFQCKDENGENQWYLNTYLAKTGAEKSQDKGQPQLLTRKVGDRLHIHRSEVIERLGPHFPGQEDQIALFAQMHWADFYDNNGKLAQGSSTCFMLEHNRIFYELLGRHSTTQTMRKAYLSPIVKIVGREIVGAQTMRHSLATEAALVGHDAITVQAILGHSNPSTAQVYVDMAFHGLLDQFDDSLKAQTESILGDLRARVHEVNKSEKEWQPSQRIKVAVRTEGRAIESGACKTEICQGVPYQCYECPQKAFVPFVESDHAAVAKALADHIERVVSHRIAAQLKEVNNLRRWHERILATHEACEQYRKEQSKGAQS